MGLFKRRAAPPEEPVTPSWEDPDGDEALLASFTDISQEATAGFDASTAAVDTDVDVLSAQVADTVAFRAHAGGGYEDAHVDEFVEDVVSTLRYYEGLVAQLYAENLTLAQKNRENALVIESFRAAGERQARQAAQAEHAAVTAVESPVLTRASPTSAGDTTPHRPRLTPPASPGPAGATTSSPGVPAGVRVGGVPLRRPATTSPAAARDD